MNEPNAVVWRNVTTYKSTSWGLAVQGQMSAQDLQGHPHVPFPACPLPVSPQLPISAAAPLALDPSLVSRRPQTSEAAAMPKEYLRTLSGCNEAHDWEAQWLQEASTARTKYDTQSEGRHDCCHGPSTLFRLNAVSDDCFTNADSAGKEAMQTAEGDQLDIVVDKPKASSDTEQKKRVMIKTRRRPKRSDIDPSMTVPMVCVKQYEADIRPI
eukprot:CAMPEP_0179011986 /NCGR_PEP_ID=MMETSP0796-20121207/960_1 /TAXON_ID=73915 /ORGANISM="Pyrodinium bahamense, Strain pbaha01" /LENGTH=211 /DNA_ID=CAMNT_0020707409 /DNA_START=348 /DNA_END=986 /DNA_ORIENTATION=-